VAIVTVAPTPAGDPNAGEDTFISRLTCGDCHGYTGAGSPIAGYDDAGPYYNLQGSTLPYPAPGLNNSTPGDGGNGPNLAADPAWSASLLGMAAQGDIDNNGVALRQPMVDWLGKKNNVDGGVLNAQDFANIYSYLSTQRDASTQ
jgi:mono/diheme cytochrome c family protein